MNRTPLFAYLLIAVNVVVFLMTLPLENHMGKALSLANFEADPFVVISSGFMHGSLVHLAVNMLALAMLSPMVKVIGNLRFFFIYFVSLLGAAAAVLVFDPARPTVGASGAIFGLIGYVAVSNFFTRETKLNMWGIIVLNGVVGFLIPGISIAGHFGGLATGVLLGFVLRQPRPKLNQQRARNIAPSAPNSR